MTRSAKPVESQFHLSVDCLHLCVRLLAAYHNFAIYGLDQVAQLHALHISSAARQNAGYDGSACALLRPESDPPGRAPDQSDIHWIYPETRNKWNWIEKPGKINRRRHACVQLQRRSRKKWAVIRREEGNIRGTEGGWGDREMDREWHSCLAVGLRWGGMKEWEGRKEERCRSRMWQRHIVHCITYIAYLNEKQGKPLFNTIIT